MDPSENTVEKLEKLVAIFNKLMHLLDRKRERHKVKVNVAYSNQPTLFLRKNILNHYNTRVTNKMCLMRKLQIKT